MLVIPLCFIKQRFAKNPKLKGEKLSSFHFIDFKHAYFENDEEGCKKSLKKNMRTDYSTGVLQERRVPRLNTKA